MFLCTYIYVFTLGNKEQKRPFARPFAPIFPMGIFTVGNSYLKIFARFAIGGRQGDKNGGGSSDKVS